MKKPLTRGERWLFGAPLLILATVTVAWIRQKNAPDSLLLSQAEIVSSLLFSPDGERLLATTRNRDTRHRAGRIYDVKKCVKLLDLDMDVANHIFPPLSWSPDGMSLTSKYPDGDSEKMVQWNAENGIINVTYQNQYAPNVATNSNTNTNAWVEPNEKLGLDAIMEEDGRLRVTDSKTKRVVWQRNFKRNPRLGWNGDILYIIENTLSATAQRTGESRLWLWDGKARQLLPSPPTIRYANAVNFSFHTGGQSLAYLMDTLKLSKGQSPAHRSEVLVWDYRLNREVWRKPFETAVHTFQWSPDGKRLLLLADNIPVESRLTVFDRSGQLQLERSPVGNMASWSPDSQQLAFNPMTPYWFKKNRVSSSRIEVQRFED